MKVDWVDCAWPVTALCFVWQSDNPIWMLWTMTVICAVGFLRFLAGAYLAQPRPWRR